MARIALVNAGWGALFSGRVKRYNRRFPPLDLLNCAAILREAGHEVRVFDGRAEPLPTDWTAPEHTFDRYVVSLSSLDRWQCPNVDLGQMDEVLRPFPSERLIVMGAQVTVRPELLLQRSGAAGAILGEPEGAVEGLADGGRPGEVPGTARLGAAPKKRPSGAPKNGGNSPGNVTDTFPKSANGGLIAAPARTLDLTELPLPAFDLIEFERYQYEVLGGRLGLLELTRGCPWRCRFCLLTMYGKKYRRKTPDQLAAEVRHGWAHGMRTAYFQDLEFTLDHELVEATCEAIERTGLPLRWGCQTRPDTVDGRLLRIMRRAGCEVVHYGVESGVPRVVATTDKRQTLEAVETGIRLAHEAGMNTLCYFLIGLPGETPDEMHRTLQFAQRVGPTWASFQVATPYPGTRYHAEAEAAGHFDTPFPECFPGPLDADELRALARRFTAEYHLRPRYLWQRLTGPGRRQAFREAGLLARYLLA